MASGKGSDVESETSSELATGRVGSKVATGVGSECGSETGRAMTTWVLLEERWQVRQEVRWELGYY